MPKRLVIEQQGRDILEHDTGLGEVGDDAYGGRDPRQAGVLAAFGGHGSDGGGDGTEEEEAAAELGEAETVEVGGWGSRRQRRRQGKPKGATKGGRSRGGERKHLRES